MYNTKFNLSNGNELYPGYIDKDKKIQLREQYGDKREYMWCGCKNNNRLFYRISEDLKLYPEHNKYEHDRYCSRYRTESGGEERKTGYVINDEDGAITAYLSFNLKAFNMSDSDEVDDENNSNIDNFDQEEAETEAVIEKDEATSKSKEKKEPKLTLASLVRSINIDTYTEKMLNNMSITSRETFSKLVYYRMNKVKPNRTKKTIGELSLETDGVRFIYVPFAGAIIKEEKGLKKCYFCSMGSNGKIYNNFIFPETMDKAIKEFSKRYGIEPNQDTMLSGFQYYKKSRSAHQYKVLGRVHLFQMSDVGIYCKSLVEKEAFDCICNVIENDKTIEFWIPPDDESVGGILKVKDKKKKILLLFRTEKDERISFDFNMYEPLVVGEEEPISKERIYEIIKQIE